MSYQGGQARERRTVGEARLDRVETCNLQAANQFGIERRHESMVGASPFSKELQTAPEPLSNAVQTSESVDLDALICAAARAANLTHGQICAYIGNGKGGAYDQSQWTKARATGDLPFGRMWANLTPEFKRHLAVALATDCGLHVSHADIADLAVARVAVAFEAVAEAFRHMRRAG